MKKEKSIMLNEISNRSEHAKRHNLGDRSPSQTKDFASGQGFKTPDKGTQHEVLRLRGGSGRGSGRGSDQGLQPPLSRDALHPGSRPSSRLHSPFETKYINPELNDQVADLSHEVTQLINASKNWAPYQAIDVQIANLDYTY